LLIEKTMMLISEIDTAEAILALLAVQAEMTVVAIFTSLRKEALIHGSAVDTFIGLLRPESKSTIDTML